MSTQTITNLPVTSLRPNPWNRKRFDPEKLKELAGSIRESGLVQPIVVRANPDETTTHEIVAGERRWRAAQLADVAELPAIVREVTDLQVVELMATENAQREDVHPLEEAEHYAYLLEHGNGAYDVPAIAGKVGKSKSYVYQRLQLAKLVSPAKKAFAAGRMTAGHAIEIARLPDTLQVEALDYMEVGGEMLGQVTVDDNDIASVRDLREWIRTEMHCDLKDAPWRKDDAELVPEAGACTACPKRTGFQPDLFPDLKRRDVCTDRECFRTKWLAWANQRRAAHKAEHGVRLVFVTFEWNAPDFKIPGIRTARQWEESKAKTATPALVVWGSRLGEVVGMKADTPSRSETGSKGPVSAIRSLSWEERNKLERDLLDEWAPQIADQVLQAFEFYRLEGALHNTLAYNLGLAVTEDLTDWTWQALGKKRSHRFAVHGFDRTSQTDHLEEAVVPYLPGKWSDDASTPMPEDGDAGRAAVALWVWRTSREGKQLGEKFRKELTRRCEQVVQTSAQQEDEPTCAVCGCTENAACPGGCAWAEETMDGRLLCTSCTGTLK